MRVFGQSCYHPSRCLRLCVYAGLADGGFAVAVEMFGREKPGIEDGQVWRDDGEEEEEEANDLGDVEGVVDFEKISQNGQDNNGCADDYTC
jgi:hypothetical protein